MDKTELSERNSFLRGYNKTPKKLLLIIREEIMFVLKCSKVTFYRKLKGAPELLVWQKEAIEDVFKKYNIEDIWGNV